MERCDFVDLSAFFAIGLAFCKSINGQAIRRAVSWVMACIFL